MAGLKPGSHSKDGHHCVDLAHQQLSISFLSLHVAMTRETFPHMMISHDSIALLLTTETERLVLYVCVYALVPCRSHRWCHSKWSSTIHDGLIRNLRTVAVHVVWRIPDRPNLVNENQVAHIALDNVRGELSLSDCRFATVNKFILKLLNYLFYHVYRLTTRNSF